MSEHNEGFKYKGPVMHDYYPDWDDYAPIVNDANLPVPGSDWSGSDPLYSQQEENNSAENDQ